MNNNNAFNNPSTPLLLPVMLVFLYVVIFIKATVFTFNAGRLVRRMVDDQDFEIDILLTYPITYIKTFIDDAKKKIN